MFDQGLLHRVHGVPRSLPGLYFLKGDTLLAEEHAQSLVADVVDHPLSDQELGELAQAPGRQRQVVFGRGGLGDLLDLPEFGQRERSRLAAGMPWAEIRIIWARRQVTTDPVPRRMIERAQCAQVPFSWLTADEAYGQVKYLQVWLEPGRGHWLLARRSLSDSTEIAYYICAGPRRTTLTELATVAGSRWRVEECFQQAKNEAGLDHYQVRTYRAWYAHTTLSMLALAWLACTKNEAAKGESASTTKA